MLSSEFLQIFRIPRGQKCLPNARKWCNWGDRIVRNWGPNMAKTCNVQTPISPPIGGRFPPFKNYFSQGPTDNNAHNSDRGSDPPKGVKIESRPKNHEKTAVKRAVTAKPEVEIWRRPQKWTFWPWFPIRSPIHLGVYLAPLLSYPLWILALCHC